MNLYSLWLVLSVLLSVGAYANTPSHSSSQTVASVPLNQFNIADLSVSSALSIHGNDVSVEIVDDDASRAQGLMYRSTLDANAGMLFVFPNEQRRCFWMKNTYIPLSIAYIRHDGYIIDILDMYPLDETPVCSSQEAMFALEVNQGWFADKGILPGEQIKIKTK